MFIEIEGRILDKRKYDREVLLMKRLLEYEFKEVVNKYALELDDEKNHEEIKSRKRNQSAVINQHDLTYVHPGTLLRIKLTLEEAKWREI